MPQTVSSVGRAPCPQHFAPRRLWHETKDGQVTIEQGDLIGRNAPVVVLGEAGMGKTELLRWVAAEAGFKFITARNLQNSRRDRHEVMGAASTIVVDALDELSARGTGDAVDTVLRRLGDLDYPNFILSCRAADWRSATNVAAICGQYEGEGLLVLHLEPLTNADIREMLRVCLRMPQWTMRRHSKLPMATWIMAVETSMRFS